MLPKEYHIIPLFEQFIKETHNGKRLKPDGSKIKPQTINNYYYALKYLKDYQTRHDIVLRVKIFKGENKRMFISERNYWKKFYLQFTNYLFTKLNCYDNYVGTVIKIIRIFFNYLNKEKGIATGNFYKNFYACKEEIQIITLRPEQLQFLINNKEFEQALAKPLQRSKAIFVFGCTVALRVSDLFSVKFSDIETVGEVHYLSVKTIKTGTLVRIKLPCYAIKIIEQFKATAKTRKTIFPPIPHARFNVHLKSIAELAGWTNEIGKFRTKRGVAYNICSTSGKKQFRFCDLVSSHVMRRTAITTMLMLGMKEHIVKQISGHSNDNKSFYRYVNFVQSYMDNEMDLVFDKLIDVA